MSIKAKIAKLLRMGPLTAEDLRARGAKVGEDVYLATRKIDLNHAF